VGDRIIDPKGRPRAPRFTERDRHAILMALAGLLATVLSGTRSRQMQGVLTTPQPKRSLKALELLARLNGGTRLAAPDVASPEAGIQGDVASGHTKLRGGR
jgi:hypothetical protein